MEIRKLGIFIILILVVLILFPLICLLVVYRADLTHREELNILSVSDTDLKDKKIYIFVYNYYEHYKNLGEGYHFLIDFGKYGRFGKVYLITRQQGENYRDHFYIELSNKQEELSLKLKNVLRKENLMGIKKICKNDYQKYKNTKHEKLFKTIISINDGTILQYFNPNFFIPNNQLTFAIHMLPDYSWSLDDDFIIELDTLKIKSVKDILSKYLKGKFVHGECAKYTFSPDGRFVAFSFRWNITLNNDILLIMDLYTNEIFFKKEIFKNIESIAWSSDSKWLAILGTYTELGKGLLKSWFKVTGHGIPYDDFYIILINLQDDISIQYLLQKKVRYGEGELYWIE